MYVLSYAVGFLCYLLLLSILLLFLISILSFIVVYVCPFVALFPLLSLLHVCISFFAFLLLS